LPNALESFHEQFNEPGAFDNLGFPDTGLTIVFVGLPIADIPKAFEEALANLRTSALKAQATERGAAAATQAYMDYADRTGLKANDPNTAASFSQVANSVAWQTAANHLGSVASALSGFSGLLGNVPDSSSTVKTDEV
jgi:hypothetical protein